MIRIAMIITSLTLGVVKGGPLYIKAGYAALRASTAKNAPIIKKLEKGTKVTWLGPDARVRTMHKVRTEEGVEGFVLQNELSPSAPTDQSSEPRLDAAMFATMDGGVIMNAR